jgi:protein O-mannosyl-transferase
MQKKQPKKPQPVPEKQTASTKKLFPWKWYTLAAGILAFLLYVNSLGHDYTVDDDLVTTKNKFTTEGLAGLPDIFTKPYRAGFWDRKEGLYRPLSVAMFAVEWQIAGKSPFLSHFINVLLYAFTGMLTVSVTRRLMKDFNPWIILSISYLYIVHPIHSEVVANIKSRDEILAFLFGMGTLYALLREQENPEKKFMWQAIAFLSFLLALFSKENALTWLGVLPLAYWMNGEKNINAIAKKMIPFGSAAGFFLVCRFMVLNTVGGDYELMLINNSLVGAGSFIERFATSVSILGRYILLLIAPVTLVFDYSYNTIPTIGVGDYRFLLSAVMVGYALFYALKNIRNRTFTAFGILFFLGTIILVSNIFLLIEATMAERFLYTPSYGFCIVAGITLGSLFKSALNKKEMPLGFITLIAVILFTFSIRTVVRSADWKDNYTLLTKDVKSNPESARIRYAYGSALLFEKAIIEKDPQKKRGYLNQSVQQLEKGVSLIDSYNDAWFHLGLAYKELDNGTQAAKAFDKARSLKSFDEASKFSNAGVAYGMTKQYDKAINDLSQAARMEPDTSDHFNNLGLYLGEAGRLEEGLAALDKAIMLDPKNEKAFYNKGNIYAQKGDFRGAMQQYALALKINPNSSDALNNTGNCYAAMQQTDTAMVWFQKALAADPGNTKALTNIGVTYMMRGDTLKGMEYINKAKNGGL